MATKHKTSSTVAAATFLALSLLLFTTHSEACGCKCFPCPNPPSPTPGGGGGGKCPIDAVKLGVCANVLGGLINLELGAPPKKPCCELVRGLADLETALCLCTVLRANVLGISLNVPVHLSLLVNICGKKVPDGFKCP